MIEGLTVGVVALPLCRREVRRSVVDDGRKVGIAAAVGGSGGGANGDHAG